MVAPVRIGFGLGPIVIQLWYHPAKYPALVEGEVLAEGYVHRPRVVECVLDDAVLEAVLRAGWRLTPRIRVHGVPVNSLLFFPIVGKK